MELFSVRLLGVVINIHKSAPVRQAPITIAISIASYANGSTFDMPSISPSARLINRPIHQTWSVGITAESCENDICVSWLEPTDNLPVYDKSYVLEVSRENLDGSFTIVERRNLNASNAVYTPSESDYCRHHLQVNVMAHYCNQSENIVNISDQPQPTLFTLNVTDPEPVTGLDVQPACPQAFHLSWNPAETATPVLKALYRVSVQQHVNDQLMPIDCFDCEGLVATHYDFTPEAGVSARGPFIFTISSGHCGQYLENGTESEEVALQPCAIFTEVDVTDTEVENLNGGKAHNQGISLIASAPVVSLALTVVTVLLAR